ncbi:MAG: hypothetical protein VKJ04_09405 [Vampirovibrionales bacterium]|nr:hypothetical protein [Vampirovibrionales bacterium]
MHHHNIEKPESNKVAFIDLYKSDVVVQGEDIRIGKQAQEIVNKMAVFMHQDKPSSFRRVFDADERYLLGVIGISKLLGLNAETVWRRYYDALGRGNGGVFINWRGYNVKLCAKKGSDSKFYAARNRREQEIGAYLLVNILESDDFTIVKPRGLALRHQTSKFMKASSDGKFWQISANKLEGNNLLKPVAVLLGGRG